MCSLTYLFLEPARIGHIIVGDPVYFPLAEFGTDVLDLFGRHARIDAVGLDLGPLGEDGPCRNDRIAAHHAIVHDDAPHAHQHIVLYGTAVDYGIVPNGNIVADLGWGLLIGAMDHGPVLYVHLVPHFDIVHIPSNHGIEPYRALVPHAYLPNYGRILRDITVFSKLRGLPPDGFDQHLFDFS